MKIRQLHQKIYNYISIRFQKYHFEIKHIIVGFSVFILFLLSTFFLHQSSLQNFSAKVQSWYRYDFAERVANLTAIALESLIETSFKDEYYYNENSVPIIKSFNIILSQQLLNQNVEEICLLVIDKNNIRAIDNGKDLFLYITKQKHINNPTNSDHKDAIRLYQNLQDTIRISEQIYSFIEDKRTFHVFVPLFPKGEYLGAFYFKSKPSFGFIIKEIISDFTNFNSILIFLLLLGLWSMFYISNKTIIERNEVIKKQVHVQKEAQFAKRMYHARHEAEKTIGFIKEDLDTLSRDNIEELREKIIKYTNFISRVIYDIKSYEQALDIVRNEDFPTKINDLISFLIENIFKRVSTNVNPYDFKLDLDRNLPIIYVNEYVIWQIIEPLIQNCIDHSEKNKIIISIKTRFNKHKNRILLIIQDNGNGIPINLLKKNKENIQLLFLEGISSKSSTGHCGYGCYIAYENAKLCGWGLKAENIKSGGCKLNIIIPLT